MFEAAQSTISAIDKFRVPSNLLKELSYLAPSYLSPLSMTYRFESFHQELICTNAFIFFLLLLFFFYSNETVYLSFIDWTSVPIHFVGQTSHLTFNVACLACPMLKLHAKCAINTRLPWHIAHFKKQKNRCA